MLQKVYFFLDCLIYINLIFYIVLKSQWTLINIAAKYKQILNAWNNKTDRFSVDLLVW